MTFLHSFSSLGYSAIVLVLAALFISAVIFNLLKLHKYGRAPKIILFGLISVGVYFSTIYLAKERQIMIEAIRDEGGLKRTKDR